jgi:hypothetical protein
MHQINFDGPEDLDDDGYHDQSAATDDIRNTLITFPEHAIWLIEGLACEHKKGDQRRVDLTKGPVILLKRL